MRHSRRPAHYARPFVITVLLLSTVAVLHYLVHAAQTYHSLGPSDEILPRDLAETAVEQCRQVHKSHDQCAFIKANCPDEEIGYLSYLSLYYCRLPRVKPLGFIIIAIWSGVLFSTIGIAASDFFCVNISTIAAILHMSESMAGVTFLAFGNGSPDVFSTWAAMKNHSGSLAIGELIGAAGFITAVVAGSMALIRPFKVAKRSFVRDVCFFIVAVSFSMVFLANGTLELWECAVMVGFYAFYVITVIFWHWWLNQRRRKQEREVVARSHHVPPGDEVEPYHDEDDTQSQNSSKIGPTDEDFLNLEAADYVDPDTVDEFEEEEERDKWLGELNSNMRINKPSDVERRNVFNPIRPSLVGALEFRAVLSSLQKSGNAQTIPMFSRRYSDAQYIFATQEERAVGTETNSDIPGNVFAVNYAPDEASRSGLLEAVVPQRARAVSANGAAGLQLDPSILRKDKGKSRSKVPEIGLPELSSTILEEGSNEDEIMEPRGRANTIGLLAPPEGGDAGRERHTSPSNQIEETTRSRPTVTSRPSSSWRNPRIILPSPKLPSPRLSPRFSPRPLTPHHDDDYFNNTATLLPPPSTSPASIVPPTGFVDEDKPWSWWPYKILPRPETMARVLFPTVYGWSEKSIWEKLIGLAAAPSFFLMTITLPIVEPGSKSDNISSTETFKPSEIAAQPPELVLVDHNNGSDRPTVERASSHPHHITAESHPEGQTWHRWLVMIQCCTAPVFMVLIWGDLSEDPVKPILFSLLASLIALALILVTTVPEHPPRWHFLLCFVGFAVSVSWISTIAGEVVAVLKTIGVIFNISDAILGLTIFAVGNSLGDLVADVTVARLGYPVMALSACFGGPLLNILLGIGGSGLLVMISGAERRQHKHPGSPIKFKPYHVQVSTTLLISAVALLVTLVGLLIAVPLNRWKMDRKIGIGLIVLWCITTVGNLVVEIGGWGDDFSSLLRR